MTIFLICKTDYSKPVKQEVNGTVTLTLLVFPGSNPAVAAGKRVLKVRLSSLNVERHDTQHNDTQHNDTQHNDAQHNDTLSITTLSIMTLSITILSITTLSITTFSITLNKS